MSDQHSKMPRSSDWRLSRWLGMAGIFVAGIVFFVLAVVAVVYCNRCKVSDRIVSAVYKNVDAPIDKEMPVTITSYPASPQNISIVGGRGEGLNCSIPFLAKPLFPDFTVHGRLAPVTRRFHQACVFHDLCYRHGLATYGYSQADCDQILREQAVRLCRYLSRDATMQQCQLDGKKVLAGVTFGGAEAFRNWDQSTFFEFDPNPIRSNKFVVSRVVDHPFSTAPARDDPRQWILTFDITRSGTLVRCANCTDRRFTSLELVDANIEQDASKKFTEPHVATTKPEYAAFIDLPARTEVSAPHLLNLSDGGQRFVWSNRIGSSNTVVCHAVGQPKHILTQKGDVNERCIRGSSQRLKLSQTDLFTASAQVVLDAERESRSGVQRIFAIGLSRQKPKRIRECPGKMRLPLRIYKISDLGDAQSWTDSDADCLFGDDKNTIGEYGLFQYPPIIKQNRIVFLSRTLIHDTQSRVSDMADASHDLRVTAFDLRPEKSYDNHAVLDRFLTVPDSFDMMSPVSRNKDDYRVISIVAPSDADVKRGIDKMQLFQTDLKSDTEPKEIDILDPRSSRTQIHASWARRPVHVVELPKTPQNAATTELIFSRRMISRKTPDAVVFEFASLRRDRDGGSAFSLARTARCVVRYLADLKHPACHRIDPVKAPATEGLQTRLQGAQLVAGYFGRGTVRPSYQASDLALYDPCFPRNPIVVQATADRFDVLRDPAGPNSRTAVCVGSIASDGLTSEIVDVTDTVATKP